MKSRILQDLKIALFGVLTLLFLFLTVLAFLPERSDVEIKETFTVSSAPVDSKMTGYSVQVSGVLHNKSGSPVVVDRLTVVFSGVDGELSTEEAVLLPPRADLPVTLSIFNKNIPSGVKGVFVSVDGAPPAVELRNPAVSNPFAHAFLPILLTLLFLALTVHASIVRVYIAQEERA